jgi:hypothetical protein
LTPAKLAAIERDKLKIFP